MMNNYMIDPAEFLDRVNPAYNDQYPWSDLGNGRLFADCFEKIARYIPERKMWYCYRDGIWLPDMGNLYTMELCKSLADALTLYARAIRDDRLYKDYRKLCKKWESRSTREIILKEAASIYPVSIQSFDSDPNILNCKNGTLHLDTMEFTAHRAEDLLTKQCPVNYDPVAHSDRFTRFIAEITSGDNAKAHFLQKAFGYGISGDTRHECLFILHGETTRNGKGTLCESILNVLGSYACAVRPETLAVKSHANSHCPSEDLARLAGIRFANISEPDKGMVLNAALVKTLTGNDKINARFLHENSFDYRPSFKFFINTNHLPLITDMTLFTSNRIHIIPFNRHFGEFEQDKDLKTIFQEPENQSAILNWLVEGYRAMNAEGLTPPASVLVATNSYYGESDHVAQFVQECLHKLPAAEVRTAEVYARYRRWCEEYGVLPESSHHFNTALGIHGTVKRKRPQAGGGATTLLLGYQLIP